MEQDTSVLWWSMIGIGFLIGLILGWVLCRWLTPGRVNNQVKQKHDALQKELTDYRHQVSEHFAASAHLLNQLTENYKDLHEHLAGSADQLCQDRDIQQRLTDALVTSHTFLSRAAKKPFEAPKDYAKSQSNIGTLSEQFGVSTQAPSVEKPQVPSSRV